MGVLSLSVLLWIFAFACVKALDLSMRGAISEALTRRDVVLYLGYVRFSTKCWNSAIEFFARRHKRILSRWFSVGVVLGFCGLFFSLFILSASLVSTATNGTVFEPHMMEGPQVDFPSSIEAPVSNRSISISSRPWAFLTLLLGIRDHEDIRKALRWQYDHYHGRHYAEVSREHQADVHSDASRPGRVAASETSLGPENGPSRVDPSVRRPGRGTGLDPSLPGPRRKLTALPDGVVVTAGTETAPATALSDERAPAQVEDLSGFEEDTAGESKLSLQGLARGDVVDPGRLGRNEGRSSSSMPSKVEGGSETRSRPGSHGEAGRRVAGQLLTPLIPGVTIPAWDVGFIVFALFVSAVVHELGHALSAASLDAKIESVGGLLFLIFPGAFVRLAGVKSLSPYRQLKIWCAGALHNIALSCACFLALSFLPLFLIAFYERGGGALVVSVPRGSPLGAHVHIGDVVMSFGRFPVVDGGSSFRSVMLQLVETGDSAGFCVSEPSFRKFAHPASSCCDGTRVGGKRPSLQCFGLTDGIHVGEKRACMSPSVVASRRTCRAGSDCQRPSSGSQGDEGAMVPGKCFVAIFPNGQKLIDIRVADRQSGKVNTYFFQGDPKVLGDALSVSSYIPRHRWALPSRPLALLAWWDVPNVIERQLQYLVSISLALAVLNMAPVYYLDGEASVALFLRLLAPRMEPYHVSRWCTRVLTIGTSLLALNVLVALID